MGYKMKNTVDNIIMTHGQVVKTPLEVGVHGVTEGVGTIFFINQLCR